MYANFEPFYTRDHITKTCWDKQVRKHGNLGDKLFPFCVCYLHMQMQTLCRAVEISITTSYSTSVKIFYRGLTEVFIASPYCDSVHEGQVKRNHLS